MTNIKRLDRLDVNTVDLKDAIATYRRNFGLEVTAGTGGDSALVKIGDALIGLIPAAQVDAEGMVGVWLEAENVEAVSVALGKAGYSFKPIRVDGSRRVLEVDAKSANQVPLFIFDRKA
jgi:ApbE superfamily uncharacterized protein (UPF0280 family)